MITSLRKIERIFVCQRNSLIEAPAIFPAVVTFPLPLISGAATELCSVTIPVKSRRENTVFFISAFINWEMTGPASVEPEPPGAAQVAFELLRDDVVIFRALDTLVRPPGVDVAVSTFGTVNLAHLDAMDSGCCCSHLNRCITYRVRANNIFFSDEVTAAAVGAVNLRIEELKCGG